MKEQNTAEMPKYQSHKQVWALKIETITVLDDGSAEIVPEDGRYGTINVDKAYMGKHDPKVGGYYVVYKGGYKSFSPEEAFESGYTLIEKDDMWFLDEPKKDVERVEMKAMALNLAIRSNQDAGNAEKVVREAKVFLDYLEAEEEETPK